MKEIWKDIKEYENFYQISNFGVVRSLKRKNTKGKILKPSKDKDGYLKVTLSKQNKRKSFFIHRLVAQEFLSNYDNLPQINHKNEIKSDNRVENLEWCEHKYNQNFGTRNKRISKTLSKPIIQYDLEKNFIKIWENAKIASEKLNINRSNIVSCLKNKRKKAGNYIWEYSVREEESLYGKF